MYIVWHNVYSEMQKWYITMLSGKAYNIQNHAAEY